MFLTLLKLLLYSCCCQAQGRIQGDRGMHPPTSPNHMHYTVHTLHIHTQISTPCKVEAIKLSLTLYICNKCDISIQLSSSYSDSHRLPCKADRLHLILIRSEAVVTSRAMCWSGVHHTIIYDSHTQAGKHADCFWYPANLKEVSMCLVTRMLVHLYELKNCISRIVSIVSLILSEVL